MTRAITGYQAESTKPTTVCSIQELADEKSAKKISHKFVPAFSPSTAAPLQGRVVEASSDSQILLKELEKIDPTTLQAIDESLASQKDLPLDANYLVKSAEIIRKMMELGILKRENDQIKKINHEGKYTKANREWGKLQKESGDRGMNFTWLSLGVMALQFVAPENDRQFIQFFADKGCQNLAGMFNSGTQSNQRMIEGVSQLAMAEINAQMNQTSTDNSAQQAALSLLERMYEALKRAAQAG